MSYITNATQLKEYILRQLGSAAHKVEISNTNWDDIYNTSLKYITEYFDEAVNEKTILMEINNIKEFTLNSNVMSVKELYTTTNDLGIYLAYPGLSPILDFVMEGDRTSVSSYLATMNYIRQINETFQKRVHFTFNSETKRLILGEKILRCAMTVLETEDVISLYNSRYFLKTLEMNSWKTWATNVGAKYKGWTVGNGMEINQEFMLQQYTDLNQELKDAVENDEYSFLGPIRLNSM